MIYFGCENYKMRNFSFTIFNSGHQPDRGDGKPCSQGLDGRSQQQSGGQECVLLNMQSPGVLYINTNLPPQPS